jgi:16S rRNA (guanine527-N7)-methyltransferase
VADVGCGAGFPLLPLAWASPGLRFTGFESRGKKADFVKREIARLGLRNARAVSQRAREAGRRPEHAGQYDVVLLRAVGPAGDLVRECRALLREEPGARMVHYKTPDGVAAERAVAEREAGKYGFAVETSQMVTLPEQGGPRQFLLLRRI